MQSWDTGDSGVSGAIPPAPLPQLPHTGQPLGSSTLTVRKENGKRETNLGLGRGETLGAGPGFLCPRHSWRRFFLDHSSSKVP